MLHIFDGLLPPARFRRLPEMQSGHDCHLMRLLIPRRLTSVPNNLVEFPYETANSPLVALVVLGKGVKTGGFANQSIALFLGVIDDAHVYFLLRKHHPELSLTGVGGKSYDRRHSNFVMNNV